MIRQPIVTIMGHVDHGKTSLLDQIRGTSIASREAGAITQAIGASILPESIIRELCGSLLKQLNINLTIPGLLFIDTPGHAAFTSLRKRGGNLADIAILVVDINEGLMPQTKESLEILKSYKTPFIIAVNKIDLIEGWKQKPGTLLQNLAAQSPETQRKFETKLYDVVAQIYELGLQADRFDRVSDFTKQVALVPVSAKSREGLPELIVMLAGLAQRFLEQQLQFSADSPGKGTILEVKEQKGFGMVLDVILYDGSLKVNDPVIIATLDKPIQTKIKALLQPVGTAEMREKKAKFSPVKSVMAATGVRIVAQGIESAVAGMPIVKAGDDAQKVIDEISAEVSEVVTERDVDGVVIKADSLGSLEAMMVLLKEKGIPIRRSSIGPVSKKDLADAETMLTKDPLHAVILGFNIPKPDAATTAHVICNDVVYRLLEEYDIWKVEMQKKIESSAISTLTSPCKIELLRGYVFRQSNPAVVGVEIVLGSLKSNTPLMNKKAEQLTVVKGIQLEQKNVESAEKGKQVAISLPNVIVGRQVNEGDILYSMISEAEFRKFKEFREHLTEDQKTVLKEIAELMRHDNPVWGV